MEALIKIQSELKAPKGQFNNFGKYKYRSCEDILEALKPLLQANGCYLLLTDDIVEIQNRVYVKAKASIFDGTKEVSVTAFAREEETKKGMDGSQVTGAASSYARKYALNGLFLIDDQRDADTQNNSTELPWLKDNSKEMEKIKEALKKGFTISQVETKYRLSDPIKQLLVDYLLENEQGTV